MFTDAQLQTIAQLADARQSEIVRRAGELRHHHRSMQDAPKPADDDWVSRLVSGDPAGDYRKYQDEQYLDYIHTQGIIAAAATAAGRTAADPLTRAMFDGAAEDHALDVARACERQGEILTAAQRSAMDVQDRTRMMEGI